MALNFLNGELKGPVRKPTGHEPLATHVDRLLSGAVNYHGQPILEDTRPVLSGAAGAPKALLTKPVAHAPAFYSDIPLPFNKLVYNANALHVPDIVSIGADEAAKRETKRRRIAENAYVPTGSPSIDALHAGQIDSLHSRLLEKREQLRREGYTAPEIEALTQVDQREIRKAIMAADEARGGLSAATLRVGRLMNETLPAPAAMAREEAVMRSVTDRVVEPVRATLAAEGVTRMYEDPRMMRAVAERDQLMRAYAPMEGGPAPGTTKPGVVANLPIHKFIPRAHADFAHAHAAATPAVKAVIAAAPGEFASASAAPAATAGTGNTAATHAVAAESAPAPGYVPKLTPAEMSAALSIVKRAMAAEAIDTTATGDVVGVRRGDAPIGSDTVARNLGVAFGSLGAPALTPAREHYHPEEQEGPGAGAGAVTGKAGPSEMRSPRAPSVPSTGGGAAAAALGGMTEYSPLMARFMKGQFGESAGTRSLARDAPYYTSGISPKTAREYAALFESLPPASKSEAIQEAAQRARGTSASGAMTGVIAEIKKAAFAGRKRPTTVKKRKPAGGGGGE